MEQTPLYVPLEEKKQKLKILFLTSAFNRMAQRAYIELTHLGHLVKSQLAIDELSMREAVQLFQPDLIIAPMLKKAIPEDIWSNTLTLIIHPGIAGDRGPSSLDWAILEDEKEWGVTILEASHVMDGGAIWATQNFKVRRSSKSSLYNNEVVETALKALKLALERFLSGSFIPEPLDYDRANVKGKLRPSMKQSDRSIDWLKDRTETVLKKIASGDGFPGTLCKLLGEEYYLYNGHPEKFLKGVHPGEIVAQKNGAICISTIDGSLWISHLRKKGSAEQRYIKLPATHVLGKEFQIKDISTPFCFKEDCQENISYCDLWIERKEGIFTIHFPFHNGAMGVDQCERLLLAFRHVRSMGAKVIIMAGGGEFWSNGIHLNLIEAHPESADEAWRNILAINRLVKEIILATDCVTISALVGSAGAGGVSLALAHDEVVMRENGVLNPHYRTMGLFGSEYWTYLLPKKVGVLESFKLTQECLPVGAREALKKGLVDQVFPIELPLFWDKVYGLAQHCLNHFELYLGVKRKRREADELIKPLDDYAKYELEQMYKNFYHDNLGFRERRKKFVFQR